MRPVAYGLGWHVVQRHRLGLSLLAVGMLALLGLRHIPGIGTGPIAGCSIWMLFGLLYVAAIFTQPEADITAPGSGYPNHLFILPIKTRELVLWPMLYGGVTLALGWMYLAGLIMNADPVKAPVVWPACMLVAILASLQALFWSPMRFPTARVFLALALMGGLIYLGAGNPFNLSVAVLSIAFLAIAGGAYGLAVQGVATARSSSQPIRVKREVLDREVRLRPPFSNPGVAQRWYEWRRGGLILPIVVFVLCVAASVPLFFDERTAYTPPSSSLLVCLLAYVSVYMGALLRGAGFVAWILGGAVWVSGARAGALSVPAFIATRPLTSLEMAVARLRARLRGASIAFGLVLLTCFLWLLLPGSLYDPNTFSQTPHGPAIGMLLTHVRADDWTVLLLYLALLYAITLRNYTVGQFASLSGKPWIAYGYMAVVYAGPILAIATISIANRGGMNLTTFYWFFSLGLAGKALAAFLAIRALLARRLMGPAGIGLLCTAWVLVALGVFGVLSAIQTSQSPICQLFGFRDLQIFAPTPLLVLMAIFWTPIARLAAIPVMLDANRRGAYG
ncbi:MAG TPA: hypothetical protein VKT78_11255 [Fimbriimonadaceae bacterium]|nr:hypothetical protein [Fimbriimonadaceae bacterium]